MADLAIQPIPFKDNFFDFVTGFDFLEHIPRVLYLGRERKPPFIHLMREIWRVSKSEGQTFFATPAFPFLEAFQDPQYVNMITKNSRLYLTQATYMQLCQDYEFKGKFEVVQNVWANGSVQICEGSSYHNVPFHLIWHLRAKK